MPNRRRLNDISCFLNVLWDGSIVRICTYVIFTTRHWICKCVTAKLFQVFCQTSLDWAILKGLGNIFSSKVAQNFYYFWCLCEKHYFLIQKLLCLHFGKIGLLLFQSAQVSLKFLLTKLHVSTIDWFSYWTIKQAY